MSGGVSNKLLLYADDSAILVADTCVSYHWNYLTYVSEWLDNDKVSLHLGKNGNYTVWIYI